MPKKHSGYYDELDAWLIDNHGTLPVSKIAERFDMPEGTVHSRIRKLRELGQLPPSAVKASEETEPELPQAPPDRPLDPTRCKHHRLCGDAAITGRWPDFFDRYPHAPEGAELQVCLFCMDVKVVQPKSLVLEAFEDRRFGHRDTRRSYAVDRIQEEIDRELVEDTITTSYPRKEAEPVAAIDEDGEMEIEEEVELIELPSQNGHSAGRALSAGEVMHEGLADVGLHVDRDFGDEQEEPTAEELEGIEQNRDLDDLEEAMGPVVAASAKAVELYETIFSLMRANQALTNGKALLELDNRELNAQLQKLQQQIKVMELEQRIIQLEAENRVLRFQVEQHERVGQVRVA